MSRELQGYLAVYITTNVLFNLAWLFNEPDRFYWPIIPMLGWGAVLALYAWDVRRSVRAADKSKARSETGP